MTTPLDDALEFLETHYPTNADGRLPAKPSSPSVLFLRTTIGCLWRFREDLPARAVREVCKLAGREPPIARPIESAPPPERLEPMTRIVERFVPDVRVHREFVVGEGTSGAFEVVSEKPEAGRVAQRAVLADLYRLQSSGEGTPEGSRAGSTSR